MRRSERGLSTAVQRLAPGSFPLGTLAVNLLGCLLIGALVGLAEVRIPLGSAWRSFLVIGLLGSFTTFSTFGNETVELIRSGQLPSALAYLGGSVALGLLAVVLGRAAVGLIAP